MIGAVEFRHSPIDLAVQERADPTATERGVDRDTIEGEVSLWYALAKSLNRPTVDLYFRTGVDTVRRTFEALGLPWRWDEAHYGREYDLDVYNIVAVNDFNIFNRHT